MPESGSIKAETRDPDDCIGFIKVGLENPALTPWSIKAEPGNPTSTPVPTELGPSKSPSRLGLGPLSARAQVITVDAQVHQG